MSSPASAPIESLEDSLGCLIDATVVESGHCSKTERGGAACHVARRIASIAMTAGAVRDKPPTPPDAPLANSATVFVTGLRSDVDAAALRALLLPYGPVRRAEVKYRRIARRGKGSGKGSTGHGMAAN